MRRQVCVARTGSAVVGLALGLSFAGPVLCADGRAPLLTYRAPAECPSEAAFLARVSAHVHETTPAPGSRVDLAIEASPSGYQGTLVAYDAAGNMGQRRIEGATCSGVAEALAFLAALAIELEA